MKILVTGHKGFIGSHVYEYFTDLGFEVEDTIDQMIWEILKQIKYMM